MAEKLIIPLTSGIDSPDEDNHDFTKCRNEAITILSVCSNNKDDNRPTRKRKSSPIKPHDSKREKKSKPRSEHNRQISSRSATTSYLASKQDMRKLMEKIDLTLKHRRSA